MVTTDTQVGGISSTSNAGRDSGKLLNVWLFRLLNMETSMHVVKRTHNLICACDDVKLLNIHSCMLLYSKWLTS